MAKIVLNWELGIGLGHVARFLTIANALKAEGHTPVLVLKDLEYSAHLLKDCGFQVVQAPISVDPSRTEMDLNFAETLTRFNFIRAQAMTDAVLEWLSVWKDLQPDLLVFDHAPTALLAARGMSVPKLVLGNCFAVPPQVFPLPSYRWWLPRNKDEASLAKAHDTLVTGCINLVLSKFKRPEITCVSDLYSVDATLVCSYPDLDIYGADRPQGSATYIGPLNNTSLGVPPVWAESPLPKVFVYVRHDCRHLEALFGAMAKASANFLVYSHSLSNYFIDKYSSPTVTFTDEPVRVDLALDSADAMISHAGGIVDVALSKGKRTLVLPLQMEQTMIAMLLETKGLSLVHYLTESGTRLASKVNLLVDGTGLAEANKKFAEENAHFTQEYAVNKIVDTCTSLLFSHS